MSTNQRKTFTIIVVFLIFILLWPIVVHNRNPILDFHHIYMGYLDPKLDWKLGMLDAGRMLVPRLFIAVLLSVHLLATGKLPIWIGLAVSLIPPTLIYFTETHDVSRTFLIFAMPILFVTTFLAFGMSRLTFWWLSR